MPKPVARSAILFGLVFLTQIAVAQLVTPPPESAENPVTEQKRVLGKILFWDEQLSSDDTVACGTCHIPAPVVVPPTSSGGGGSAGIWLLLLYLAFVMNNNPFHLFRPGTKDASISTAVFGGINGIVCESQESFGAIG